MVVYMACGSQLRVLLKDLSHIYECVGLFCNLRCATRNKPSVGKNARKIEENVAINNVLTHI